MSNSEQWKNHKNEIEKILSEIKAKEDEIMAAMKIAHTDLKLKSDTITSLYETLTCLIGRDADSDLDLVVSDLESSTTNISDAIEGLDCEFDISRNCDEVSQTMAELEQNPDRSW